MQVVDVISLDKSCTSDEKIGFIYKSTHIGENTWHAIYGMCHTLEMLFKFGFAVNVLKHWSNGEFHIRIELLILKVREEFEV